MEKLQSYEDLLKARRLENIRETAKQIAMGAQDDATDEKMKNYAQSHFFTYYDVLNAAKREPILAALFSIDPKRLS